MRRTWSTLPPEVIKERTALHFYKRVDNSISTITERQENKSHDELLRDRICSAVSFSRALFVIWLRFSKIRFFFLLPVYPMVKGTIAEIRPITMFHTFLSLLFERMLQVRFRVSVKVWVIVSHSNVYICLFHWDCRFLKTPALTVLSGTLDKSIPEPCYASVHMYSMCLSVKHLLPEIHQYFKVLLQPFWGQRS